MRRRRVSLFCLKHGVALMACGFCNTSRHQNRMDSLMKIALLNDVVAKRNRQSFTRETRRVRIVGNLDELSHKRTFRGNLTDFRVVCTRAAAC